MLPPSAYYALGSLARMAFDWARGPGSPGPSFTAVDKGEDEFGNVWVAVPDAQAAAFRRAYPQAKSAGEFSVAIRRLKAVNPTAYAALSTLIVGAGTACEEHPNCTVFVLVR